MMIDLHVGDIVKVKEVFQFDEGTCMHGEVVRGLYGGYVNVEMLDPGIDALPPLGLPFKPSEILEVFVGGARVWQRES